MGNKVIKIKSDGDSTLKKLVNDVDRAETMEKLNTNPDTLQQQQELNEKWSPEQWYAELRKRWYFHNMSWYMIQETPNNEACPAGVGCNPNGCVEQCFFYTEEGRIE